MTASAEQLHELLIYCMDFAKIMLKESGDFYPFGAFINEEGKLNAVGGDNGNERPKPHDIYRLLSENFIANAASGTMHAAAIAANVNIPLEYESQVPDGIRIHLESSGYSRYIYIPYELKKSGFFKKTYSANYFELIPVEVGPVFFVSKNA